MTRVEFTQKISALINEMVYEGEHPIIDYVKRSTVEQKRLFEDGLSNCDGVTNPSKHQSGKAMDIYFVKMGGLVEPSKGLIYWHNRWEEMGGQPMIDWDRGHFEG